MQQDSFPSDRLVQSELAFTSIQQQSPNNPYVDLAVFGSRHVEEEIREITIALMDVRPLGEDLSERRDAFLRRALVGRTESPLEILDHPDVLPELWKIRCILSQRSVQYRPCATGINEIASTCSKTGVRNVQRETIEGVSDNRTDISPS